MRVQICDALYYRAVIVLGTKRGGKSIGFSDHCPAKRDKPFGEFVRKHKVCQSIRQCSTGD